MTVEDAEDIIAQGQESSIGNTTNPIPVSELGPPSSHGILWRTIILTGLSLLETVTWLAIGSYRAYTFSQTPSSDIRPVNIALPFVTALTWFYVTIRSLTRYPRPTPPYGLFTLFIIQFFAATLDWAVLLFMRATIGFTWPTQLALIAKAWHWITTLLLLVVVLGMPLRTESDRARRIKKVSNRMVSDQRITNNVIFLGRKEDMSWKKTTQPSGAGCKSNKS